MSGPCPAAGREGLTDIERGILAAVAAGSTPAEVAVAMGLPESDVDEHVAGVLAKLHRRRDAPVRVVRGASAAERRRG